jgi:acyl-CoA reductase-like NAD-dependent aldehyde dehydrogenase
MIARKIALSVAAGCTVICEPAEDTPLTSLALVKLADEAHEIDPISLTCGIPRCHLLNSRNEALR